jgi:lipid A 4'-phosphatase
MRTGLPESSPPAKNAGPESARKWLDKDDMNARTAILPFVFIFMFMTTMGVLVVFPEIDVATSRAFYTPGIGFSHSPILAAIQTNLRFLVAAIVVLAATLLVWPRYRRTSIFLLVALALGPGFLVNTVFKDHWGRARPSQIVEFGGGKALTSAFVPADQCMRNCSFPAGDPAVGFFLISGALLIGSAALRRWSVAGAVLIGGALGIMRIAQGGHFLSDVIASGFLVTGLTWALHRVIVAHDGLGALARILHPPLPISIRLARKIAAVIVGRPISRPD